MQSRFVETEAEALVARYAARGVPRDLALRVYTTRLLGGDPKLVLHGGGNTSVKLRMPDLMGREVDVLCVKGSGADMAVIEPAGLPAVRLAELRLLLERDAMSDEEMVKAQRANLLDPMAPNPSVETLLHAFIPQRFVDHTHATTVLSLIDQADGAARAAELYDGRMGIVPYIMPGFGLAKEAARVFAAAPGAIGLILHKHGIFTFGESAREAYERMIEMVSLAEAALRRGRRAVFATAQLPQAVMPLAAVAPIVRGACSLPDDKVEGAFRRLILDFRTGDAIINFVNGAEVGRYATAGVVTPDHTIRTKNWPLVVPAPEQGKTADFARAARAAVAAFIAHYREYFARNNSRCGGDEDHARSAAAGRACPRPRAVRARPLAQGRRDRWRPRRGRRLDHHRRRGDRALQVDFRSRHVRLRVLVARAGKARKRQGAAARRPDRGDHRRGRRHRRRHGKSLRGSRRRGRLARCRRREGCGRRKAIGGAVFAVACDVTDAVSVDAAFAKVAERFGGVDIVVSNAGAAWQGRIGEVAEEVLRKSFELNFYGHQRVAQAAVRIMLAQDTGGCLLFNVSKQAVNPGPDFGPYGLPKAATLFLARQYAVDYGTRGIRANVVNADRVRSGLLTADMIAVRSTARGLSEKDYMSGNLLGREVTADDVAQAFVAQALALKTTAGIATVDGGNIAAALR